MPAGIPVGTLAIGKAGAVNAALLAASVLALSDEDLAGRLDAWRAKQTAAVAERHGALLHVDEAHATGCLGPEARGAVAAAGLDGQIDVLVGTLGKALGSYGAYAACSAAMADLLQNAARPFIFSTAPGPPQAAAALAALDLIMEQPSRAEQLQSNADALRDELAREGFDVSGGSTHIIPIVIGPAALTMRGCEAALQAGGSVSYKPLTLPTTHSVQVSVVAVS